MENVSPEGLRLDGRRDKELRRLNATIGVLQSADGSATFEMGNTKVRMHVEHARCRTCITLGWKGAFLIPLCLYGR
jgi:ribonuclease PH